MSDDAVGVFESHLLARGLDGPVFVGLDGRSGAGKSTLAARLADRLERIHGVEMTVVEGDQFYAGGSGPTWDRRTAAEKADRVIDWERQHAILTALRSVGEARWHPFDWTAPDWDAAEPPLADESVHARLADVVLLEGAYSCRPELHPLLDVLVLLDPPTEVRRRQLLAREGDTYRTEWEGRWAEAEDQYFGTLMPPDRFDLVIVPAP